MKDALPEYRLRLNGCGVVLCEPAWNFHVTGANLPDYDLWYVWAGRGAMRFRGREYPLFPGVAFCLPPRSAADASHDSSHRLGVCFLHFDLLDSRGRIRRRAARTPAAHCVLDQVALYESILRRAVECAHATAADMRAHAAALVAGVLHAMDAAAAAAAPRPRRRQAERIAAIVREIRQDPGRRVSVAELARAAGYSADHFARVFENETGAGPRAFIIRGRVDRARQLLIETDLSVDQIARTLGYADIFTFSKQFKAVLGASPMHWRDGGGREEVRRMR